MNLNYNLKYLKYKKKYLELKNQKGGIKLNLSGPVSIHYYTNKKFNKKIIVLGDKHDGLNNTCNTPDLNNNSINIIDYLTQLFNNDMSLDLFIEADIPNEYILNQGLNSDIYSNYKENENDGFIVKVILFCIENYNKNENKRIHFTDNRNNIKGFEFFDKFDNISELLKNINNINDSTEILNLYGITLEKIIISRKIINETKDLLKFYNYFFYEYNLSIKKLLEIINNDNNDNNNFLPELIIKEINNCDPIILQKILNVIKIPVQDYLNNIKDTNIINVENIDKINELYNKGIQISAYIADLYTILLIINNSYINNSILYVGDAHIEIINTYLNALDFILEYEKKNIPDYIHTEKIENDKILENENSFYRCIYNIIPFTDFFNNKF